MRRGFALILLLVSVYACSGAPQTAPPAENGQGAGSTLAPDAVSASGHLELFAVNVATEPSGDGYQKITVQLAIENRTQSPLPYQPLSANAVLSIDEGRTYNGTVEWLARNPDNGLGGAANGSMGILDPEIVLPGTQLCGYVDTFYGYEMGLTVEFDTVPAAAHANSITIDGYAPVSLLAAPQTCAAGLPATSRVPLQMPVAGDTSGSVFTIDSVSGAGRPGDARPVITTHLLNANKLDPLAVSDVYLWGVTKSGFTVQPVDCLDNTYGGYNHLGGEVDAGPGVNQELLWCLRGTADNYAYVLASSGSLGLAAALPLG